MTHGWFYTQSVRIYWIFWIQTEIRWCLPFSDWFITKQTSCWFQINQEMVNIIRYRFDLIRFLSLYPAYSTVEYFIIIPVYLSHIGQVSNEHVTFLCIIQTPIKMRKNVVYFYPHLYKRHAHYTKSIVVKKVIQRKCGTFMFIFMLHNKVWYLHRSWIFGLFKYNSW